MDEDRKAVLRDQRGKYLNVMRLVSRDGDSFKVTAPGLKGKSETYKVWREDGKVGCTCTEYEESTTGDSAFRCEHIYAVKYFLLAKQESEVNVSQALGKDTPLLSMTEAGFSITTEITDSHGRKCLITFRDALRSNWQQVLNDRAQALEKLGVHSAAPQLASQSQPKHESNGGQYKEFDATQIIKTFDDNGELRIKIKGRPFEKFGVPVYEEDFSILGIDLDAMPPGTHPFNHRVRAILKEDGKTPRKIVEVLV